LRFGWWLLARPATRPLLDQLVVLRLLVAALTLVALVETLLLLVSPCVPLLLP